MTKQLQQYIKEFKKQRQIYTEQVVIQAKELRSLRQAIKELSEKENLAEEDRKEIDEIINIVGEWWVED